MIGVVIGVVAVGVVTLVVALALLVQTSRKLRVASKIPGPHPLPVLGNALELKTDGAGLYSSRSNEAIFCTVTGLSNIRASAIRAQKGTALGHQLLLNVCVGVMW